jgi:hypothetical protein
MLEFNESPLFLLVDATVAPVAKELPLRLYESYVDGTQTPPRTVRGPRPFSCSLANGTRMCVHCIASRLRRRVHVHRLALAPLRLGVCGLPRPWASARAHGT